MQRRAAIENLLAARRSRRPSWLPPPPTVAARFGLRRTARPAGRPRAHPRGCGPGPARPQRPGTAWAGVPAGQRL